MPSQDSKTQIIFVYNVDSTIFSLVAESLHKVISPQTYQCNLCKLTYGLAFMDTIWKKYLITVPYEKIFMHRDEFSKNFPSPASKYRLPAVFIKNNEGLSLLLNSSEIQEQKSIKELIGIMKNKLSGIK